MGKILTGFVKVDEYRGHDISLNKATGKYAVDSIVATGLDTIKAAHNAITKFLKAGQENVRQPVIVHRDRYSYEDHMLTGTLTSFSIGKYRRGLSAIVVFGPRDRDDISPDRVYKDTPENRELMARYNTVVDEIDKLEKELEAIREKKMKAVDIPKTLKEQVVDG